MNEMEAIKILEKRMNRYHPADAITTATELAVVALREQAERSKGCEHCRGWDSRCGASYCPMCGRELGKRLEVEHE